MMVKDLKRESFLACNWVYEQKEGEHYGYSSVQQCLRHSATEKTEEGELEQSSMLSLLERAASMMLEPASINEPFLQYGTSRSATPNDFTLDELNLFESILYDIEEPWLTARLADILWLCKKPKRNIEHVKLAVESYISHTITSDSWHRDVGKCWHRAARLCLQIKDTNKLEEIKTNLYSALQSEYPDCVFMQLWLAELLDELYIDEDYLDDITAIIFCNADDLYLAKNFHAARSYFELAAKKADQLGDTPTKIDSLIGVAICFVGEAELLSLDSKMVANTFYENAIQAYRKIPKGCREKYDINQRISDVRAKLTETGQAALKEMSVVRTPGIDISPQIKASVAHVSDKGNLNVALRYFIGLYSGVCYQTLESSAQESMQKNPLCTLFASSHIASDGRVIGKTPGVNFNAGEKKLENMAVLKRQIQKQVGFELQLVVQGRLLPGLRQLLMEYSFTLPYLESLCHYSPFVPENRESLTAYALWLGFEYNFSNAIHLLCPQLENMVRVKLKESGANTSNLDLAGIENENGLSTLMDLSEALDVFGENLVFEIKSIFTDSQGSNLRNEVAHGLLDDQSSGGVSSVYAWWLILRLILKSYGE